MSAAPSRLLLASIHDVSPRFESEVDRLLDLLTPHVGERIAMLVVPNHWGDAPILPGSPFATRLRRWAAAGMEMFLHGFTHRDDTAHTTAANRLRSALMTASEGEFLGLPRTDAASRIANGRALLEEIIGRSIDGFVAPAWLYGAGALEALEQAGVRLAEDHLKVWSPASGRVLARGPVITWASRTRLRLDSSLVAARLLRRLPMQVLRIGVHPPDTAHPALVASISQTFAAATAARTCGRYADLLTEPAASAV